MGAVVAFVMLMVLAVTCSSCSIDPGKQTTPTSEVAVPGARSPVAQFTSSVVILARCPGITEDVEMGTGVVVSKTKLLTAHHVVGGAAPCTYLAQESGKIKHVLVVDVDLPELDITRMRLTSGDEFITAGNQPVAVGPRPSVGDRVCAIGMVPMMSRFCGDTQWRTQETGMPNDIDHSIITQPGNSGGGIYDSRGRLVGITTMFGRCVNGQFCVGRGTSLETRGWLLQ